MHSQGTQLADFLFIIFSKDGQLAVHSAAMHRHLGVQGQRARFMDCAFDGVLSDRVHTKLKRHLFVTCKSQLVMGFDVHPYDRYCMHATPQRLSCALQ
jgi:hypothetical protein